MPVPPPAVETPPTPPPPAISPRPRILAWASLGGGVGVSSSPTFAAALGGGVQLGSLELGVEGRYDAPSSTTIAPRGQLSTETLSVGLVPCVTYRALFGCIAASLGSLSSTTRGIVAPRSDSTLVVMAAARVGLALPVRGNFVIRFYLEGRGLLNPPEVDIDGQGVYDASPVAAFLFASPTVQF
jgi:hypothetical protein